MSVIDEFLNDFSNLPFVSNAFKVPKNDKCAWINFEFTPLKPVRIPYIKVLSYSSYPVYTYPPIFVRTYLEEWEHLLTFINTYESVAVRIYHYPAKVMTLLGMMTKVPVIEGDNHGVLLACERLSS